jgi:hypothetical protein
MSGILNLLLGGASAKTPEVPFYYVTSLMAGNGTNGGTNNTFNDTSIISATITRNGTPTQGLFTPFSQPTGYWSNHFNGSDASISFANNAAFNIDTICSAETFFYSNATGGSDLTLMAGNGNWDFLMPTANGIAMRWFYPGYADSGVAAVVPNTWNHIAFSLSGGRLSVYLNGVRFYTNASVSITNGSGNPTYVGWNGGNNRFNGFVSNTRITKGSTPYDPTATTIVVPTSPLTAITNTQLLTCQNYRFKDNSSNNFTATLNGTPKIIQFAPFTSGTPWSSGSGASLYFDGSGDYLTNTTNTYRYIRGLGDWTFECFVYPFDYAGASVGPDLFAVTNVTNGSGGGNANGFHINMGENIDRFRLISNASGSWTDNLTAGTGGGPPLYAWTHMAMVREGDRISIFKNGTRVNTGTGYSGYQFSPTAPNTAGNYSLAVQEGKALNATSASDVFGTGNFTAEFFVYRPDTDFASGFMLSGGSNSNSFELRIGDGNRLILHSDGGNVIQAGDVTQNQWVHCCVVRSGGNMSAWVAGTRVYNNPSYTKDFSGNGNYYVIGGRNGGGGLIYNANMRLSTNVYYDPNSTTISPPYGGFGYNGGDRIVAGVSNNVYQNSGQPDLSFREGTPYAFPFGPYTQASFSQAANSVVGRFYDGGTLRDMNGFIAFPRFQQNAVYSASASTITVPTSAIGNDGNTLQLLQGTNGQAIDSTLKNDWVTVGGAQISTTQSKYGGSSIYFNGTDAYLKAASSQERIFRTGDFTIEGWVYPTSWSNANAALFQGNGSSYAPQLSRYGSSSNLGFCLAGVSWIITDAALPALNTWTHVAVSRSGTTIKIFLNGVQSGSTATSAADFTAAVMSIGANNATEYFAGYMDDARITTGYAVYTTNFKAPATALPTT